MTKDNQSLICPHCKLIGTFYSYDTYWCYREKAIIAIKDSEMFGTPIEDFKAWIRGMLLSPDEEFFQWVKDLVTLDSNIPDHQKAWIMGIIKKNI